MVENAYKDKVDIIIFPEMSMTGFSLNTNNIAEDFVNSETIQFFKNIAIKYNMYIGFGVVIKDNDKALNKFIIIDYNGDIIANYDKIHPFSFGDETKFYNSGNKIEFCKIKDVITTPFICYDLRFPEIFQYASTKSEIIFVIANWPKSRIEHWKVLLKARAIENQCFIVAVNRIGEGNGIIYNGNSMIVNPYGEIIACSQENEGILATEIDTYIVTKYRDEFKLKLDRKNDFYVKLY